MLWGNTSQVVSMDWEEIGKRAFNRYFNWFRKTEDHDESQKLAGGEIEGAMDDEGIEIEYTWYADLPVDAWIGVATGFMSAYQGIEKEVGYAPSDDLMGPMHTWFSDCMYEATLEHEDAKLQALLDEFNKM